MSVPTSNCIRVPDAVPLDAACAALLQGLTAIVLTRRVYPVAAGDTVLVHAAAGGTGSLILQACGAAGATVIATSSTPEKQALVAAAGQRMAAICNGGAVHSISYQDFPATVKQITGGAGVHAAFDGVGKDTFEHSLACLRKRGVCVLFGAASGQPAPIAPSRLTQGSLFLTRPSLFDYIDAQGPCSLASLGAELFDLMAAGKMQPNVGLILPLRDAKSAHDALEQRRTTGKVLLHIPQ